MKILKLNFQALTSFFFIVLFFGFAQTITAEEEDLYAKFFNQKEVVEEIPFALKTYINGKEVGSNVLRKRPDKNEFKFTKTIIAQFLPPHLNEDGLFQFDVISKPELTLDDFSELFINYKVNISRQTLHINIKPQYSKPNYISLKKPDPVELELLKANAFGGYINLSPEIILENGESSQKANLSSVVSLYDFALINEVQLNSLSPLEKRGTTLHYMNPNNFVNVKLGEFTPESTNPAYTAHNISGFQFNSGIIRDKEYVTIEPKQTLILDKKTLVTLKFNDFTLFEKKLYPGVYIFNGFTLLEGLNKGEFTLTTRREVTKEFFSFHSSSKFFAPRQFYASIGAGRQTKDVVNPEKILGSLYLRHGNLFSLNKGNRHSQDFEHAISRSNRGTILSQKFKKLTPENEVVVNMENSISSNKKFFLQAENTNLKTYWKYYANFRSGKQERSTLNSASDLQFGYGTSFTKRFRSTNSIRVNTAMVHLLDIDDITNRTNIQYTIAQFFRIKHMFNLRHQLGSLNNKAKNSTLFTYRVNYVTDHQSTSFYLSKDFSDSSGDLEFGFYYTYNFNKARNLQINHKSLEEETIIDYRDRNYLDAHELSLSSTFRKKVNSFGASYAYNLPHYHPKFFYEYSNSMRIGASTNTPKGSIEVESRKGRQKLNLQTAIVFTGDAIELSKPVQNNFVLVKTPPELAKGIFHVNETKSWFSDPVLTGLPDYNNTVIAIDRMERVDPQVLLKKYETTVRTLPYKNYTFRLEALRQTVTMMSLYHKDAPIKYHQIQVTDNETGELIFDSFTNRRGKFVIPAIEPGEYTLTLPNTKFEPVPITIKKDAPKINKLGIIEVY